MKEDDDNQDDDCDDDGEHDQEFQEFKDWLDAKVPDAATASPLRWWTSHLNVPHVVLLIAFAPRST